jgi:pimeloyl-ACP methyl ester carboxylesterase
MSDGIRVPGGKSMVDENPVIFQNRRGQYLAAVVHVPWDVDNPPVLVMAHGFTDDKVCDNRLFVRFARLARERGFAVLRFDFAGSGDSEGDFCDMTVTREIEDLESVMEFSSGIPCLANSPVYLIGYSLGAAVALSVAARNENIRGIACWAPVSDLPAVFRSVLGVPAFAAAQGSREIPCRNDAKDFLLKPGFFTDLDSHHPVCDIAELSPRPVLVVQGTADVKVLPEQTETLFSAAREPKALHTVQGAPHSFAFHEEELFEITLCHFDTWNREARSVADKRPNIIPSVNFTVRGQA